MKNLFFILVSVSVLTPLQDEALKKKRELLVDQTIAKRGVKDKAVLDAMKKVPRHLFVPEGSISRAFSLMPR